MNPTRLQALFSQLVLAAVAPLGTVSCGGSSGFAQDGSPADSGSGSVDAGQPSRDSGQPNEDAGQPSRDAGQPNEDAGQPNEDAGQPGDAAYGAGDSGSCSPQITSTTSCGSMAVFPCGLVADDAGLGEPDSQTCNEACGATRAGDPCYVDTGSVAPNGTAYISCGPCGTGRRPTGLSPASPACARDVVGGWLAATAHLEAASVPAFVRLAADLTRHGAPRSLIARARCAARDEARHARIIGELARRRGGRTSRVVVRPTSHPSLARLAIENAVEGCVRETYGALVATWQAAHASDPEIREAMAKIAEDETRHAALAWAIDAWASRQLTAAGRARVERARQAAAETLLCELGREPPVEAIRDAGVPAARAAVFLAGSLQSALRAA